MLHQAFFFSQASSFSSLIFHMQVYITHTHALQTLPLPCKPTTYPQGFDPHLHSLGVDNQEMSILKDHQNKQCSASQEQIFLQVCSTEAVISNIFKDDQGFKVEVASFVIPVMPSMHTYTSLSPHLLWSWSEKAYGSLFLPPMIIHLTDQLKTH